MTRLVVLLFSIAVASSAGPVLDGPFPVSGGGTISADYSPGGGFYTDIYFEGSDGSRTFWVTDYGYIRYGGILGDPTVYLVGYALGANGFISFLGGPTIPIYGFETRGPIDIQYIGPYLLTEQRVLITPVEPVPEPKTAIPLLIASGGLMLIGLRKRRLRS